MRDEIEDFGYPEPDAELDRPARAVIGTAIEVHRHLGPCHLESVYENSLCKEIRLRGIPFQLQVHYPVDYKGEKVGEAIVDLIVAGVLVVELKAVESIAPIHKAQVIAYLKVTHCKLGLLINFNTILLKEGINRIILS